MENENDPCIILFIFSIIINAIILYNRSDKFELMYIKTVEKAWEKHPILDISLSKKDGYEKIILLNVENINICDCSLVDDYKRIFHDSCNEYKISKGCIEYMSNKASKIFGTELYAKYYNADYLTLFSRLENNGNICKEGYKRCGYLDDLKNTLCVKEEEICPINYLHFDFIGNKASIIKITTDNQRKDLPIITSLLISDKKYATIFDINEIDFYESEKKENNPFNYKHRLIPFNENYEEINKINFFVDNKLIKGDLKLVKNDSCLYLFKLIYPGNNRDSPLKMKYLKLIYYNFYFKIFFAIIRFYSFMFIFENAQNNTKSWIFIIYIIVIYLNNELIKGETNLTIILKSGEISSAETICYYLDFVIIILLLISSENKLKKNVLKSN